MNQRPHQSFAQIIAYIVVCPAEVLFTDVIEDIVNTGHHLVMRETERVDRVQHSELRHDFRSEDVADLLLCLVVGNDGSSVHYCFPFTGQDRESSVWIALHLSFAGKRGAVLCLG